MLSKGVTGGRKKSLWKCLSMMKAGVFGGSATSILKHS